MLPKKLIKPLSVVAMFAAALAASMSSSHAEGTGASTGYLGFPLGVVYFERQAPFTFGARGGWVVSQDFTLGGLFQYIGQENTTNDALGVVRTQTNRLFAGLEFFAHFSGAAGTKDGLKAGLKTGWAARSVTQERQAQRTHLPSSSNAFVGFATGYDWGLGGIISISPEITIMTWNSTIYTWIVAELRIWL